MNAPGTLVIRLWPDKGKFYGQPYGEPTRVLSVGELGARIEADGRFYPWEELREVPQRERSGE